ncbi:MAG TPA: PAS domain S-box protein [Anaeromyxobacter sp.]
MTPFPEILGHAPDAVFLLDAAAFVVDLNEEACRTLGYSREELSGKHVREFVEGLEADALARMQELLKQQRFATFRAVHRRKDGTVFPVETRLVLVRRDGPPLVVAFARDVSDQEAARRALRESEERYRQLVELLPDGVLTYAADGRIAFANAAAARIVGAARTDDLVGTPALERIHPESRDAVRVRMARALRGSPAPLMEHRLIRLDGTATFAEVTSAPLDGGSVLVVLRDVSERHRAGAERAALEERLRQAEKIEALGTLAGGVAHDFNNVLAAIMGHAEALSGELPPGSIGREDAEQIAAAARRAKGIVQQILAFARRRPPETAAVDVARAVREELTLVRAATAANVEIRARTDVDAGAVRADPTQLHQVLLNLCANARDAMATRGGGVIDVVVERVEAPSTGAPAGLAPGSYVRLVVGDTGQGMDAATRARAVEPYFTTKPVGAGSGLGLSVVHGIATGLGGAVSLESAQGSGTRVEVWLPRLGDADAAPRPSPRPVTPGAAHRARVLLVDDDPPVARAMRRMLETLGYEVATHGDAESAFDRFRADPAAFDVVLTDQTLPGMGGDELTVALLAVRPSLPVLICTGYSPRLDEAEARLIGARALLSKPIDVHQLGEAVAAALAGR